ncbi:MAG: 2-C-methyl-D-erythritol 4-phosphate cytidylyltransferase [Bacteroidales bacterium]|nr:2-C-methyl-D-erythritol 4-phosphate cytidylyltransferase [Bacteroidales bacterium]
MKKYAIIVAGGTGTRMKGEIPKQFMLLNGKPVILYSIEAFFSYDPAVQIILVIHPDYLSLWMQLVREFKISIPFEVAEGGKTRFDSVKNGLRFIGDDGFVAVHDAARPVINADFLKNLFSAASTYGSAIPVVPVTDTIRIIEGDTSRQQDRKFLRAIQTPQVFKVSELQRAYMQPYEPNFTDDGSVMEAAGFPVHLAEGRRGNMKITHLEDIEMAEVLIKNLTTEARRT